MKKRVNPAGYHRRVAIYVGAGFIPELNSALMAAFVPPDIVSLPLKGNKNGSFRPSH